MSEISTLQTGDSLNLSCEANLTLIAEGGKWTPKFDILAYTGAEMNINGFRYPVIIDIGGLKASGVSLKDAAGPGAEVKIPVRMNHDANQGVGHTTSIRVDGANVHASGIVSRTNPSATDFVESGKSGFPWQASVGVKVADVELLDEGYTTIVNGQNHKAMGGPVSVVRAGELYEISLVDHGADSSTRATVAANRKENCMEDKKEKAIVDQAADATVSTGKVADDLEASGSGSVSAEINRMKSEREREQAMLNTVKKYRANVSVDKIEQLHASAEEEGWSAARFEREVLLAANSGVNTVNATVRDRGNDVNDKVVEAALAVSAGLKDPEKVYNQDVLDRVDDNFSHGLSLNEALCMGAERNGKRISSHRDINGMLEASFSREVRAAGASTMSIPTILNNVANKFLLQGYNYVEQAWRDIARIRSVSDFKQHTNVRLTGDMEFENLGADGEIEHATAGELSYTNQAKTTAKMFAVTRQDLINDDTGALSSTPQRIGRGAAIKFNKDFWTEFLDNSDFFKSDNDNYETGAATALGIDALKTIADTFASQTDADGNPLGSMPRILLVPVSLQVVARQLMQSTELRDTTASTKYPVANPWAGMFNVVISQYLQSSALTGYSSKAWYLLADPMDIPVIEVAFLNGVQTPTVEQTDADFNRLGIQFRGFFDYGVSKQDYRAGVKAKGEA